MKVNTERMTRTLFTLKHLEPCRVRMSDMWHAQREDVRVCASNEVFCAHPPSRSGQLPLSGREKKDNYKSTTTTSPVVRKLSKKNQDCGQAFWLMVTTSDLSSGAELTSFLMRVSTSLRTRADVVLSHHFSDHLLSFQSCWCQFEVREDELHQDELGDQLEEEEVGWGRSSAKHSAQWVLSHSRYLCSEGPSW